MRILLWPAHYLPYIGGLEVMTHSLALELKRKGHEVRVVSNNIHSYEKVFREIDGIESDSFPLVNAMLHRNLSLIKKNLDGIHQLLDSFQPDLFNVHGWFECFSFYQIRVLNQRNLPCCLTVHGLLEQADYNTHACKELWSKARAVNTVSRALVDSLIQHGFNHPSLQVIHNGLKQNKQTPLPSASISLVMIGRLSEEKCFDIGFQALRLLLPKYPDLKLILVGDGPDYAPLLALRKSLGLEDAIEMTGFVRPDQVNSYIDQSELVVIPSRYESFCLVALEAAIRGKPVVASDVYGLKEVVENRQTGLLVEPKNPIALAEAVDQLLSEPQKRKEMGNAAQKRADSLFTIEKTALKYIQMYETVLEKNHGSSSRHCHHSSL